MVDVQNKQNRLTKTEQATNVAYKMMSEKITSLEQSLKKTQDESEKERQEKHELDKKVVLLESKIKNNPFIKASEFISTAAVGFSINYITSSDYQLGVPIMIAGLSVYIICIVLNR